MLITGRTGLCSVAVLAMFLVSCVSSGVATKLPEIPGAMMETPEGGDVNMYYIGSNCELSTYDDNLRIGVGNFRREEYIGEQGTRREGFSAVLWLTVGDGSVPPQTVRVHAGQEVAFSEYWVRVVEVDRSDEGTYFVRVAIGEVGEPGEGSPGD